jgi:hypothetical protein
VFTPFLIFSLWFCIFWVWFCLFWVWFCIFSCFGAQFLVWGPVFIGSLILRKFEKTSDTESDWLKHSAKWKIKGKSWNFQWVF